MSDLLIEIGAEEIPAGYIEPALKAFKTDLEAALAKERIEHGSVKCMGTPRRLALVVEGVADEQKAETSTITGPPERIGFDENGAPTIAAEKFAQKAGVALEEITIDDSDRGRYLSAVIENPCAPSADILETLLPGIILGLPFPKRMRWGDLSISFARPIISVTGLLKERPLNFIVGDIASAPWVFGHQFMAPGKQPLTTAAAYEAVLESAHVIVDIDRRKALLRQAIEKEADQCGCTILEDEELVDIVTNLVEYPFPVVGTFDDLFLELPDEVLITAMREHQKYFALADANGRLKPRFIAVNNTRARDMDLVAKGHGKVIRARLADAKFFFDVDLESTMDDFAEKLKRVTFQASLGSMYEKRTRLVALGHYLAPLVENHGAKDLEKDVVRAAQICKSDLVSQMVIEFTRLQGMMGRFYAKRAGENDAVAWAVEQHYMPVSSGGALPGGNAGRLLAVADKIDTIAGCFSIDLLPTGASDPYALRRQAIGILQIMEAGSFEFSLEALVAKSVSLYISDEEKAAAVSQKILGFIKERLTNMMVDRGYARNAVNSALAVTFDNIPDTLLRIKALDAFHRVPDFESLATAFKRVVNILKKEGGLSLEEPEEDLFEADAEKELYRACTVAGTRIGEFTAHKDYDSALKEVASLGPWVDRFFDDVMVMVDDTALKNNRTALLSKIAALFSNIADFSQL
ncbi:MAG TPA: glycine--tRNA ligase subunit beta [Desulfobacteraceae bacterium]|nr:glycine--tRNA ligase subunit beta [Desulfobacteraceae bacterium]